MMEYGGAGGGAAKNGRMQDAERERQDGERSSPMASS